jgi:membrane fusion protein (multidrug efflux system)
MSLSSPQAEPQHNGQAPAQQASIKDAGPEKPSPLKNPVVVGALIVVGAGLLILAAIWFVHYWTRGRFVQSTNDAYIQADQVTVATRVSGFVNQVLVQDNQSVQAGQPLVRVDDRDPRAKMEQAMAQVDQGRASVVQAQAQIHQQEAQIAQLEAQLAGAKTQAKFAERQASRYGPLAAAGAETAEKYDQMRQNRDEAQATMAQDSAAALAARRQIDTLKAQILTANAQIEQAQAQVRQAKVDLDATLVRASMDGRIGDKTVRVGQYVQPGTAMMTVVPVQNIYLVANFKETQLSGMRVGQPATIKVDALGGKALKGVVDSFSPGTGAQFALFPPNNATGNFTKIVQRVPTRIRIDAGADARKVLAPGLSATVSVDTSGAGADR